MSKNIRTLPKPTTVKEMYVLLKKNGYLEHTDYTEWKGFLRKNHAIKYTGKHGYKEECNFLNDVDMERLENIVVLHNIGVEFVHTGKFKELPSILKKYYDTADYPLQHGGIDIISPNPINAEPPQISDSNTATTNIMYFTMLPILGFAAIGLLGYGLYNLYKSWNQPTTENNQDADTLELTIVQSNIDPQEEKDSSLAGLTSDTHHSQ